MLADYAIMNDMGVTNAGGGTAPPSANISSAQGFFVQAIDTLHSVTFKNTHRTPTNNTFLRNTQNNERQRIWIKASLEDAANNEILIGFAADGQLGKDDYDAKKLIGNGHLAFYSYHAYEAETSNQSVKHSASKWAIQGLPLMQPNTELIIPLGIHVKTSGKYTFDLSHLDNFNTAEYQLLLVDNTLNTTTDLRINSYPIHLAQGEYSKRFSLKLIPVRVTAIEDMPQENQVVIYSYQSTVYLHSTQAAQQNSRVELRDLFGKTIYQDQFTLSEKSSSITFDNIPTGIYLIMVETAWGKQVKRIWLE